MSVCMCVCAGLGERAPTGSPRPLCRAPLCARSERRDSMAFREHARRDRGGREGGRAGAEGGGTRGGTVRAAAARPAPLAPRAGSPPPPGRRWSSQGRREAARRRGARARPACGGDRAACRSQGAGGRGAGGPRAAAPGDAAPGRLRRERGRRAPGGRGVGRAPPLGGAAPSRAFPRRSVVPAARLEAGPAAPWVCTPAGARPSWRAAEPAPGARPPRDFSPAPIEVSHANLALRAIGAVRGRVVEGLGCRHGRARVLRVLGFCFLSFHRSRSLITQVTHLGEFWRRRPAKDAQN